ncbi:sigma factor-like helix-turn-helix DNA-binding protein [Streptomyces cyaneofuscatus]|uniref:sigma factor-like helix-turn-helix DNA-binding protein n=1 Tax=Streptomyces cyaneofuscatus TaxID=66883 RepID=UPI0038231010
MPIDADQDSPSSSPNCADITGGLDPGMELVENLHALAPLPTTPDDRDRTIISLRFGQEMAQAEIGRHLGVSRMHIFRILNRILAKLRAGTLTEK